MNILVDRLPTDYEGLKINTNFRSFILFELLMHDKGIRSFMQFLQQSISFSERENEEDKIILALNLFFEEVPKDIKKGINAILWFYSKGKYKNDEIVEENNKKKKNKKIYSYEHDADLIYTAFLDQYKLDCML